MAQTKLTLLTIVVLFLLSTATTTAVAKKHKECDFKTITEDESCKSDWKDLKPVLRATQNMLGYAWVQYKIDKHMGSQDDAQDELDEKVVPVCKGPGDLFYVLDHHHLLAALDASDYPKARPTMHVVCDLSDSKTTQEVGFARPSVGRNSHPSLYAMLQTECPLTGRT